MTGFKLISLKKLVLPALFVAVVGVGSVGFAPHTSAMGSSPGLYTSYNCRNAGYGLGDTAIFNNVYAGSTALNRSYKPANFCLVSYYKNYIVDFQKDGNLVVYRYDGVSGRYGAAMWASGTNDRGATRLTFQTDGNLVIYAGDYPLWSTNTWGRYNATRKNILVMQNDGNLVVYQGYPGNQGPAIWARSWYPDR